MILYYQLIKIGEVVKVKNKNGGVAKRLTAPDLKSDILERVSWVRILPPPQITSYDEGTLLLRTGSEANYGHRMLL